MRDRLEKFIKTEGLAPSRFAEIMAVQPSSISHLLGGRNKPSYDFIEKILLRFPKLNPDWLILGKGNMYRPAESDFTFKKEHTQTTSIPTMESFFYEPSTEQEKAGSFDFTGPERPQTDAPATLFTAADMLPVNHSSSIPENVPQTSTSIPDSVPPSKSLKTPSADIESNPRHQRAHPVQPLLEEFEGSEIERIVVFLKDKTFINYRPK